MCTWCLTGVVCDLLIRVCVSELGMCIHVSRCALTVGPRSMCSGSVLAAPLRVHIIIIIVITFIMFDGS